MQGRRHLFPKGLGVALEVIIATAGLGLKLLWRQGLARLLQFRIADGPKQSTIDFVAGEIGWLGRAGIQQAGGRPERLGARPILDFRRVRRGSFRVKKISLDDFAVVLGFLRLTE